MAVSPYEPGMHLSSLLTVICDQDERTNQKGEQFVPPRVARTHLRIAATKDD